MAEYNNLMATINAQIKANGNQEITGPVLNAVLAAMVNVLGTGYRFIGVAHDTDNPGTPDNRVVYIAAAPGEYTDFDDVEVPDDNHVYVLTWDSAWTAVRLPIYYDQAVSDMLDSYIPKPGGTTAGHLAMFDGSAELEDSGIPASEVITDKGTYPEVEAGAAQSLDTFQRAAVSFLQRIAGGGNCGNGPAHIKQVRGKTVVFNQILENGNFVDTTGWMNAGGDSISVSNNVITATSATDVAFFGFRANTGRSKVIADHIYYAAVDVRTNQSQYMYNIYFGACFSNSYITTGTNWQRLHRIAKATATGDSQIGVRRANLTPSGTPATIEAKNFIFVDLTAMFGAGNEPATVEEFEALYPLPYYDYNAAEVLGFKGQTLQTNQLQQWDEEWELGIYNSTTGQKSSSTSFSRTKNFIPVSPNTQYYYKNGSTNNTRILYYDAGHNYITSESGIANTIITTPAGCAFVTFFWFGTTYNHDICISRSGFRNGEYEPYTPHNLQLDVTSWEDENIGAIYPDGMHGRGSDFDYANVDPDGYIRKTTKVWDSRAYQAGDESDASVITDGTTTWYKITPEEHVLTTPVWADFYVNQFGTERWLPENDQTPYTAPCDMDVIYPVAPSVGFISADSLKALLNALADGGVIVGYSMVYNPATNTYDFII